MYFRMKKTPSGQVLQLVESHRNSEGSPRQNIVLSLGKASIPEKHWPLLARVVENHLYGGHELFPEHFPPEIQSWYQSIVRRVELQGRWRPGGKKPVAPGTAAEVPAFTSVDGVLVDQIEHGDTAILGPYLVAWKAWQDLELDSCLTHLGFNESQRQAACVSVLHRLCDPGSERRLLRGLVQTAMPELVGESIIGFGKDRYYRVSDRLYRKRSELESHLRRRQRHLFGVSRTIFLYDLTNTYFEGSQKRNPKAARGHSKHKRDDSPQVVVGMLFDQQGFSLGHQLFEGNRTDAKTLVEMLEQLSLVVQEERSLFSQAKPVVIMDAGIATKENLNELRARGYSYLVNDSRRGRKAYEKEFNEAAAFETIAGRAGKTPVRVRLIEDPVQSAKHALGVPEGSGQDGEALPLDRLVLCRSEGRRAKEQAMRSKVEDKFVGALDKLKKRVAEGRLKAPAKIDQAIGRVISSHPRAAHFYEVRRVARQEDAAENGRNEFEVTWSREASRYEQDGQLLGCYVLRTDQGGLDPKTLWESYVTLARAEAGFRCLKSEVGLRPNHHQTEERVEGHIFISILAYHLLQTMTHQLREVGDHRSWETLKRVLETHTYSTITVPTANREVHRIRKAGRPDETQKAIYRTLGVDWDHLPVTNRIRKTVIDEIVVPSENDNCKINDLHPKVRNLG